MTADVTHMSRRDTHRDSRVTPPVQCHARVFESRSRSYSRRSRTSTETLAASSHAHASTAGRSNAAGAAKKTKGRT